MFYLVSRVIWHSLNALNIHFRAKKYYAYRTEYRPAIHARACLPGNVAQQDLPAAGASAPLARVLGLGRQESLTPDKRDVCLVRRNEATFGTFFDA